MEPTLDRAGLLTQLSSDLGNGQFLEVAQKYHFEVMGRQRLQGIGKIDSQFIVGPMKQQLLGYFIRQWLVLEHHPRELAAFVLDDREQPR
ncbi:hypothetical protein G6F53_014233 [Rhizopus delemar]|nr:hypothetical protein G6F53_014233 [Rhizopus delemar]